MILMKRKGGKNKMKGRQQRVFRLKRRISQGMAIKKNKMWRRVVVVKMNTKRHRVFSAIKLAWERAAVECGNGGFYRGWRFRVVMYGAQDGTK